APSVARAALGVAGARLRGEAQPLDLGRPLPAENFLWQPRPASDVDGEAARRAQDVGSLQQSRRLAIGIWALEEEDELVLGEEDLVSLERGVPELERRALAE